MPEYAQLMVCRRGLLVYKVAHPAWRVMFNRYPNRRPIGICAVTGRVAWSLVWGRA